MKYCLTCNEPIISGPSSKLYCNSACKMKAWKERNKEVSISNPTEINLSKSTQDNEKVTLKASRLTPKQVALELHKLDLQHQRKLIRLDLKKQSLAAQKMQLEEEKERHEEELVEANAKKQKEIQQKMLAEANRKAFTPIKTATQDILLEIIENKKKVLWPIEQVEELIEDIVDTIDNLRKYSIKKHLPYRNSTIYQTLDGLKQELEEIISDESYYETEEVVIIDFKKSYIRELQTVLEQLENGLGTD